MASFGSTSIGRTVTRAGAVLRRQIWLWPIIAVTVLSIIGFGVSTAIQSTMESSLTSQMKTLVSIESTVIEKWMQMQEGNAQSLADDQTVRMTTEAILEMMPAEDDAIDAPKVNPIELQKVQDKLAKELNPSMTSEGFTGFVVSDKQNRIVASSHRELIGKHIPQFERHLNRALEGQALTSTPFASVVLMQDESGKLRTGVPMMCASAPIRDQNLQIIGVLSLRIRPEREFTNLIQLGQSGQSGDTYAFDKAGLMVSNSRFDHNLILLGILPDTESSRSILNLSLRDPGGDMTAGYRPKVRRSELPLTKMAQTAISGVSGVDVKGYTDYRGVKVVGAWTWLPKYEMGIASEMEYAEAFRPLTILRWVFFSMFSLLILSSAAIYIFMISLSRLRREAQKATIQAKQLGQYQLETLIGSGAMGTVYRGHHAMLRRQTAIKLLNVDHVSDAAVQRFENEVKITCILNHPSTIAIYDYGRTPEGVFYYAMEYLDGINLQMLVERYGPQPEGRVIQILKQVCGSLFEAHTLGLVHRDIKPANIMLNRRGGEPDVIKVLDFGLVKALDDPSQGQQFGISGTPLYMSPEAIQTPNYVDARSDLYAVGAVGYFLLTGRVVFDALTLAELCQKHASEIPDLPSQRVDRPISEELEHALMSCLEKNRAKRPQTARDLANLLQRSAHANAWTTEDAEAWWAKHERHQSIDLASSAADSNAASMHDLELKSNPTSSAATHEASKFDQTIVLDNQDTQH